MTTAGWATMLVIMGVVWGGFALLLATALRRERSKQGEDEG